jgi:hypothetical protein
VERVVDLDWPTYSELNRLSYLACHALQRALSPERVYMAAFGSQSGLPMTYAHYHLHVVPVMANDERPRPAQVFSWTEGVVTYDEAEAQRLVASLRDAWPG